MHMIENDMHLIS